MVFNKRILYLFFATFFVYSNDVEEIIVTGSILKNSENDMSPVQVINENDFKNLNITNIGEISKYLNISSGSRFQTNALEGVDQGMSSITYIPIKIKNL